MLSISHLDPPSHHVNYPQLYAKTSYIVEMKWMFCELKAGFDDVLFRLTPSPSDLYLNYHRPPPNP